MAARDLVPEPALPFPIFRISSDVERYMLYDVNVVTWLRKTHRILGVLIGTLPQISQQNVFLGLPLELMPEEAKLLTEKGLAFIVNDSEWHESAIKSLSTQQKAAFQADLAREGKEAARAAQRKKLESAERAMRRLRPDGTLPRGATPESEQGEVVGPEEEGSGSLFSPPSPRPGFAAGRSSVPSEEAWAITPTTSYPLLSAPTRDPLVPAPNVRPAAYALFKHLHAKGYYMSPGLRFGCQFCVYPGDPLRFHSHFLAVSYEWDEEIDLMDIVGGGRLGTGVKKAFMIGGPEDEERTLVAEQPQRVRTFSIEWAGL
jgi:tRNA-splicing endonuclease subunit Sen34